MVSFVATQSRVEIRKFTDAKIRCCGGDDSASNEVLVNQLFCNSNRIDMSKHNMVWNRETAINANRFATRIHPGCFNGHRYSCLSLASVSEGSSGPINDGYRHGRWLLDTMDTFSAMPWLSLSESSNIMRCKYLPWLHSSDSWLGVCIFNFVENRNHKQMGYQRQEFCLSK